VSEQNPQKFFPVGWDEFHRNGKALAWKLADKGPWIGIIAVTRGGLVPAVIVARELEVRVVETVSVVGYTEDDTNPEQLIEVKILKEAVGVGAGEGWLVIDDLVDTGRTLELLRHLYPKAHYATVYAKPMGKPLVDTFVTEVSQDTWIYFPWEIPGHNTPPS
jgi:xanthine phosphoribosyltransferase